MNLCISKFFLRASSYSGGAYYVSWNKTVVFFGVR